MSDNRAKRQDVAKIAGVSEATVSFVFSKKRYVSEELTTKVKAAAKHLDYQPDLIARSMVTKNTNTIAVLTSDIASPLQMEVIKSIQAEAIKKGYFVNVCSGANHFESYIDNFINRRIDGIFLSVNADLLPDYYIGKLVDKGISVIITSSRKINDDRVCGIELDFESGINDIIDYLSGLGHEKIAYISSFDEKYEADIRLSCFKKAMQNKLGVENAIIECGSFPYDSTIEAGMELARKLLKRNEKFTAAICTNDLMAMGVLSVLNDNGIFVPKEISVVGIDDIVFAKAFNPPLTTLSHNAKEFGKKIFEVLQANMLDKSNVQRAIIKPFLIERKSTAERQNDK